MQDFRGRVQKKLLETVHSGFIKHLPKQRYTILKIGSVRCGTGQSRTSRSRRRAV